MCFSSAGELGERPGAVRSAGHRAGVARRSDRGVLLFAYFLLDKVATRILRSRDIRTSLYCTRKYADRGSGTASIFITNSIRAAPERALDRLSDFRVQGFGFFVLTFLLGR